MKHQQTQTNHGQQEGHNRRLNFEKTELLPTANKDSQRRWNTESSQYTMFEDRQTRAKSGNASDCAHDRVQFKLLMDLIMQYRVSLALTRWAAGALMERAMAAQLGNWSSALDQLTMGIPQGSSLSPVFFNVYTKGLADLNQNGPSKILILAEDGLIYKTSKDSQEAAKAVQLGSVSKWCRDTGSLINPERAQTLWFKLKFKKTLIIPQGAILLWSWRARKIMTT